MLLIKSLCAMLLLFGVLVIFQSMFKMRRIHRFAVTGKMDEMRVYSYEMITKMSTILGVMVAGVSGAALVL